MTGPAPAVEARTVLAVRYAETDMMCVVHHAVYPVWFEVGRTDLMLALGLPYTQIEARGYYLMLSGLNVEYRRAAKYGDSVTILTRAAQVRSRTITFSYAVYRAEELLATGETRHIATDHAYRPARLPDDVQAALSVGTR